VAMIWGRD